MHPESNTAPREPQMTCLTGRFAGLKCCGGRVHVQISSGAPRKGYRCAAAGSRRRFARLGCSNRAGATRGTVSLHIEAPLNLALLRKAAARWGGYQIYMKSCVLHGSLRVFEASLTIFPRLNAQTARRCRLSSLSHTTPRRGLAQKCDLGGRLDM